MATDRDTRVPLGARRVSRHFRQILLFRVKTIRSVSPRVPLIPSASLAVLSLGGPTP